MDSDNKDGNPYPVKLIYFKFQPLEVVSRFRDSQPQVVKNVLYLFNFRPNIYKSGYLNSHFLPKTVTLKGQAQAKIIKKSILFWLLNMTI